MSTIKDLDIEQAGEQVGGGVTYPYPNPNPIPGDPGWPGIPGWPMPGDPGYPGPGCPGPYFPIENIIQ